MDHIIQIEHETIEVQLLKLNASDGAGVKLKEVSVLLKQITLILS